VTTDERPGLAVLLIAAAGALAGAGAGPAAAGKNACPYGNDVRYRGETVDLDLRGADVHDVFRLLARVGGVNVVVADEVRGTVTLQLRRVPWTQVFCTVAHSKRLEVTVDRGVYLVRPAAALPAR
jgi:type II secretory pathway component HofQ